MKADKFLIGIVVVIVLIVVAAFAVTLTRPEETYLADDSPENVVHNYLLALQQNEFDRAYSYLSPDLDGFPSSVDVFERDMKNNSWRFREDIEVSLSIEGAEIKRDQATVQVLESQFYGGGLLDSGQTVITFEMELIQLDGEWKITNGDYYFAYCWTSGNFCK